MVKTKTSVASSVVKTKRGRGRPRKVNKLPVFSIASSELVKTKRGRGRPRKVNTLSVPKKSTVAKSKGVRTLNCAGVGYARTKDKWLATIRYTREHPLGPKTYFCGYRDTEEEAVRCRDEKLLSIDFYGGATYFKRDEYDLKTFKRNYDQSHVEDIVADVQKRAVSLASDEFVEGNLFTKKKFIPVKNGGFQMVVTCNQLEANVGTGKTAKAIEKKVDKTLVSIIKDYENLRKDAIAFFTETPCELSQNVLLFAHGLLDTEKLFNDECMDPLITILKKQGVAISDCHERNHLLDLLNVDVPKIPLLSKKKKK